MLFPSSRDRTSKTGEQDSGIFLDATRMSLLAEILQDYLKDKTGKMWDSTYQAFYAIFKQGVAALGLGNLLPYQLRHSGASMNACLRARSQEEIRRRGHWRALKSVARYEKSGRLELTWKQFPLAKRVSMEACELHLEDILKGELCQRFASPASKGGEQPTQRRWNIMSSKVLCRYFW